MKINKYIMVLGMGLMALTSCNMDEAPTTSVSVEDANHAINDRLQLDAMERGINQSFRACMYGDMSMVDEVMCDGFNATSDFGNNKGPIHRTDVSLTASDEDVESMWSNMYGAIKNYNIFIDNVERYVQIDTLPENQAEARYGQAEARFFRAYSYLQLVRHYAKAYNAATAGQELGVPLVLHFDLKAKPARATVAEVYNRIKVDLDSAALQLNKVAGEARAERPTVDALNMMYARYYLDIKDYTNAAKYAQKVIDTKKYLLSATADEMAAEYTNDEGTEPIMQLPATLTENGSGTNKDYTRFDAYALLKQHGYPGGGLYEEPYFLPSQKLLDQYEDNDLRGEQWFQTGVYTVHLAGRFFARGIITFNKYEGNPALTSNGVPNGRQHVKPFLISEAYLIAAEANFKAGNVPAAKTALNAIQKARKATLTEATEETIENEWFKETVGEGLRMSCLKRWGKGFDGRAAQPFAAKYGAALTDDPKSSVHVYDLKKLSADDYHWAWPIPAHEFRLNDNLKQNKGYDENEN